MAKKRFPDASPRVTGKDWEEVQPELQEFLDKLVFAIVNVAAVPGDISNETSARAAADNVLSNSISNLNSAQVVLSNLLSNLTSAHNALSNRVSANSGGGGGGSGSGSVTSTELSNVLSVANAASNAASVVSQALSVAAAALSVRIDTQSQSLSVHSQQISVLSQQVSALSQAHSALSQAHSVLSNVVSNEISNRTSADNALSQAISVVSNAVSVVSQAVSAEISNRVSADNALSVRIDTQSQSISVLSQALSALSQAHSVLSQAVSNEISNRVSADNVLSQGISVVSQALSNEISNRTSADNVLSLRIQSVLSVDISVLSQQISVVSQQVSALSQAHSVLSSLVSNLISSHNAISNFLSGLSARSVGNVSTKGLQSILNALSNRISAIVVGGGGSVTSTELSIVSANAAGNLAPVSAAVTSIQGQISTLSERVSALQIMLMVNGDGSVVSAGAPVFIGNSTSTFHRANATPGTTISAEVQGLVLDGSIAVGGSGRILIEGMMSLTSTQWDDVASTVGGLTPGTVYYVTETGVPTSGRLVAGAGRRPVGIAISNNVMLVRLNNLVDMTRISNAVSAANDGRSIANAASNAVSIVSAKLASIISVDLSAHSQALSVHSQLISVLSQQVSVISQQVSVISQQVSVISQTLSVISAGGLTRPQVKAATNIQIISAVALTNVSGLSVSVTGSGAVYRIMGCIMYTLSVAASPIKFGATWPGTVVAAGQWYGFMSIPAAGITNLSTTVAAAGQFNGGASGSIVYSAAGGTSATVYAAFLEAVFVISTAGTIQLQAGASTTTGAIHIQQGSYIQAFRIV